MDTTEPRYRPDWPSRVLALFSLLVVGIAVGYLVVQQQVALSRDDLRADFRNALQLEATRQQQRMDEQLAAVRQEAQKRLDEQLAQLDQNFQELASNHRTYLDQLAASNQANFSTLRQELQRDIATRLTGSAAPDAQDSVATADADRTAQDGSPEEGGPIRQAAHLVFRPVTNNDHQVRVENPTDQPIRIRAIAFTPRRVLSSREVSMQDVAGASVDRQVVFEPTDNQSADPALQGVYRKTLSPEWTLEGGESQVLELAIRNAEHLGYVLTGELELHVEGQEGQELPPVRNISVPFIGQEPAT